MNIVSDQAECDAAFRQWADTMIVNSTQTVEGWVIEGKGVFFTNYGHGKHGEITNQVALGFDPKTKSSTVKIVKPNAAKFDKGPITVLARDENGHRYLLREGRLQKNKISSLIKENFAGLTKLSDVPLTIEGRRSGRHWYIVADLTAAPNDIVAQTAEFTLACARARTLAGGEAPSEDAEREGASRPTYGVDENGSIIMLTMPGGTIEVQKLQGYVYQAIKKLVGNNLSKPKRGGYCVDGFIKRANLLIEIKTGTSAHCIYEGIGQLRLYPNLIGIEDNPEAALVIPDHPALRPAMIAALDSTNVAVFTYKINYNDSNITIVLSKALIKRCLQQRT